MVDFKFKMFLILCVLVLGTPAVILPNMDTDIAARILRLEEHGQHQQIQTKRLEKLVESQQNEIELLKNHNELLHIKVTRFEERNADQQTNVQHLLKHKERLQTQIKRILNYNNYQQNKLKHLEERCKLCQSESDELIQKRIMAMEEINELLPKQIVPINEEHDKTNQRKTSRLQKPDTHVQQLMPTPLTAKSVNRITRADTGIEIAFFATLSNDQMNIGAGQTIKFDNVITNIGNGYHNHLGTFIAPVEGTYVFSVTLMSGWDQSVVYEIVKNGGVISQIVNHAATSRAANGSQTFILQLNKDDDIVISNQKMGMATGGNDYSTFAGFLLKQHHHTAIVG